MRNFLKQIKRVLTGAVFTGMVLSLLPSTALADGPRFNFLDGDKELLRGANVTKQESTWRDPVSGEAGEVFAGLVYYHNGIQDTVARNTKIKVSLPTATANKQAKVTASVSADNAAAVSDTLTVNLDADARVEFIPGSVVWYPDQNQQPGQSQPLPLGQSGNEIISAGGLNLGEIKGCWDFAGFVIFKFKTIKKIAPPAKIEKSKIAKNLNTGEEGIDIKAYPGNDIWYTLMTANKGGTAETVTIADDIADILELSDILAISDGGMLKDGTINWPAVSVKPGEEVTRAFKVKVKSPLPNVPFSDFIMTNIYGNKVMVRLPVPVPGKPVLQIEKFVRNFTESAIAFVNENEANPGDTLEYKIIFKNTGDADADSVNFSDTLPANVQYLPGTTVISINNGLEKSFIDGITGSGLVINLPAGSDGYIKFKAIISGQIAGGEILTNTGHLKFGTLKLSDTAITKIKAQAQPTTPPAKEKAPELPVTGAENIVLGLLLTKALGVFAIYRAKRKKLAEIVAHS